MAVYIVVFQLLALVQWRARAQTHYTCIYTYLSVTVGLSGSQDALDWQWIRVCRADSRADLSDCQWPSSELIAASLQLLSGHWPAWSLGLQDCICASDEVMSNLNFSTLNLKLEVVVTVAVGTATSPFANLGCRCSAKHPSPARCRWWGRRRWSAWKLAPPARAIPLRRCHDIGEHVMKSVISHDCDIRSYWYQRALSWLICSDVMSHIIRFWYHSRFFMICIRYHKQNHKQTAQETSKWLRYCQKDPISYMLS
jgi:hypothetical protein